MSGNLTGNVPTPMDYFVYLSGHGYDLSTVTGFAVNLSDSGIDNATQTPTTLLSIDWVIQPTRVTAASSTIGWLERQILGVRSRVAMDMAL
jgi:hypothetical protein